MIERWNLLVRSSRHGVARYGSASRQACGGVCMTEGWNRSMRDSRSGADRLRNAQRITRNRARLTERNLLSRATFGTVRGYGAPS